jgi:hypothetical protein
VVKVFIFNPNFINSYNYTQVCLTSVLLRKVVKPEQLKVFGKMVTMFPVYQQVFGLKQYEQSHTYEFDWLFLLDNIFG